MTGWLATSLAWLVFLIYAEVNRNHSGLLTLSTVSLINRFDDMVNASVWQAIPDETMRERVAELLAKEKPGEHIHAAAFMQLQNQWGYSLQEIQRSVRDALSHGWQKYWYYKWQIVVNQFRSPLFVGLYLVGIWELCYCLYFGYRRQELPWLRLEIWGLIYGGLVVGILGGNTTPENLWQSQRYMVPILPVFYVLAAMEVEMLYRFWRQYR